MSPTSPDFSNGAAAPSRSLLPIYLCCLAFGLQAGTGMPLVPLALERQGVDNLGIGDSLLLSKTPVDYFRHIILNNMPIDIPARAIVLVFDEYNWNVSQAVNVAAVDDTLAEGDRVVVVSHSVLSDDSAFDHSTE